MYINDGTGKFSKSASKFGYMGGPVPRDSVLPVPAGVKVDEDARKKAAVPRVRYHWERLDFTGDGMADYMLCLDRPYGFKATRFYAGLKDGTYRDVSAEIGLPQAASIGFADADSDGRDDAYVLARGPEAGIYLHDGRGHYRKVADSDADQFLRIVSGGCYMEPQMFVDFDNDGVVDLATLRYRAGSGSAILRGLGGGRFKLVQKTYASWGQCVVDVDNDGLLDVVAASVKEPGLHVWRNVSPRTGSYLRVSLKGGGKNPFGANAVVEVFPAGSPGRTGKWLGRQVAGADGLPCHFGLGKVKEVDLKVTFASGRAVEEQRVAVDQTVTVEERSSSDRVKAQRHSPGSGP